MNLRETGIREEGAFFVRAIRRRDVAAARVGCEIKNIPIAAGRKHDRVGRDVVDFTRAQIADHDSLGVAIDNDNVEHFGLGKHLYRAGRDLATERLITAEKKLLAGLAASLKSWRDLRAAERPIGKQAAVLAREGNALRDALID